MGRDAHDSGTTAPEERVRICKLDETPFTGLDRHKPIARQEEALFTGQQERTRKPIPANSVLFLEPTFFETPSDVSGHYSD
jgi:hypothetical protein